MKLMTKDIEQIAQAQYPQGDDMDQLVVAKFFNPAVSSWAWYLMNQDPENPDYLWGIVKGIETEMGSFSLSELESLRLDSGFVIVRDLHFKPIKAIDLWNKLQNEENA